MRTSETPLLEMNDYEDAHKIISLRTSTEPLVEINEYCVAGHPNTALYELVIRVLRHFIT